MHAWIKKTVILLFVVSGINTHASIIERDDVKAFINSMVVEHGFELDGLNAVFKRIKLSETIVKAISRPAEALPWYKYRPIFLKSKRINLGVEFWKEHKTELAKAESQYGVPAEIIVSIIGVETRYGRNVGKYKVINSLATLAFNYPKRAEFFKNELQQYLLLVREQGVDPHAVKGSYAGAMGIPQFISSSYRRYAVDFDNDGLIDIWKNPIDAIGSVANYFKVHGWKADRLIAKPAHIKGMKYVQLLTNELKPEIPIDELVGFGITVENDFPAGEKVKLLELENENGGEYWLGFENFYVITRYNHSLLYAMAVYQLAMEIRLKYMADVALNI